MLKQIQKLLCLSAASTLLSSFAFAENGELASKTVRVYGPQKGAIVSIIEDTPGNYKPLMTCTVFCKRTVKTDKPLKIRISMASNKYGVIIRKEKDAKFDGKTYKFDIKLGTPDEENQIYFNDLVKAELIKPDYKACLTFNERDLTSKAKPCFRFPPPIPPKSRRSGVCKVRFYVLPDGSTDQVHVEKCSEPMFEPASVEAAKLYRYFPKLSDGVAVKSGMQLTMKFTMRNGKGKIIPAKKLK